ncbi:restriction endonuclease subunit S [Thalassotalea marina]|uniref:Type I restriction modification DNA specificity domain-containing protein n=1 Tax=Thalassotalea marina TaxID=1673741 RepID=A0A919BEP3_9GAMM|nr:restriction endonuclease subunit S [Thalassotalea marina]GHF86505.1 hypothetical protein GCM10017161_12770 [Thalassotalea marina]
MKLKPYGSYSESGVEWIGETPSHWKIYRNKEIFKERGTLSSTGSEKLLTVSHITGVTLRSEKNVNMFMAESHEGYKLCKKGDLIVNTMWAWMGALGTAREDGICSPAYGVYEPRNGIPYDHRYFDYLYRTKNAVAEMTRYSKGIVSSRLRLYPKEFFQIFTALPTEHEQNKICNHIEKLSTLVDKKIALLKKKKELYLELIDAIISERILKGIDDNTDFDDSGVEWIGPKPKNWKVVRVKDIAKSVNGGAFKESLSPSGIPIVKIQQLTKNTSATEFCDVNSNKIKKENKIKKGDLLFSWSTLIMPFVYAGPDAVLNQHIFKIICNKDVNPNWLYFYLRHAVERLSIFSHGSTMQHILKSDFDNLEVVMPDVEMQIEIADSLNADIKKIELIIDNIDKQIKELVLFKDSVTADAVLGKVDLSEESVI